MLWTFMFPDYNNKLVLRDPCFEIDHSVQQGFGMRLITVALESMLEPDL